MSESDIALVALFFGISGGGIAVYWAARLVGRVFSALRPPVGPAARAVLLRLANPAGWRPAARCEKAAVACYRGQGEWTFRVHKDSDVAFDEHWVGTDLFNRREKRLIRAAVKHRLREIGAADRAAKLAEIQKEALRG